MLQTRAWLRLTLLTITVLGGLHGIVISLRVLFSPSPKGFGTSVIFGGILVAYIYVTTAGIIFGRQPNHTQPLMWALAIQVPWISLPGLVYKFSAGLYVAVAFIARHDGDKCSAGLNGNFNLGSSCEFRLLQDAPIELGVNVAALAALFFLNRSITSTSTILTEPLRTGNGKNSSSVATRN